MANFCTNCGTKIRKEDKYCTNCGTKIRKDNEYCVNCGAKLEKDYNYCINCGTKTDKSDIKPNSHQLKSKISIEIEKENRKLKTIDELFESEEIKSEIRKNKIDQINVSYIKNILKNKLSNNMSEEEIKDSIKIKIKEVGEELKKSEIAKEKENEMKSEKIKVNQNRSGGYCSLNCRHCYEEFLDSGGAIIGDFSSDGLVEYYCRLRHPIAWGRYCEDYE